MRTQHCWLGSPGAIAARSSSCIGATPCGSLTVSRAGAAIPTSSTSRSRTPSSPCGSRPRSTGDVGAWIWGIAVRRLIDQLRKRTPTPSDDIALIAERVAGFEDWLLDNGAHGAIDPAMRSLHPDLRAVLILTAVDGLSTKEAAAVLGIPQGTVKSRLQRAKANLKELLT